MSSFQTIESGVEMVLCRLVSGLGVGLPFRIMVVLVVVVMVVLLVEEDVSLLEYDNWVLQAEIIARHMIK